jgi:hypothetical protein
VTSWQEEKDRRNRQKKQTEETDRRNRQKKQTEETDRRNRQKKQTGTGAAHEELAQHLSVRRARARTQPAIYTPDTAAGDRFLLAGPSDSG